MIILSDLVSQSCVIVESNTYSEVFFFFKYMLEIILNGNKDIRIIANVRIYKFR